MAGTIHMGRHIREELRRQGRSVAWLSRQLGISRMTCYRIFESYSIDTHLLLRISTLLKHDFFGPLSDQVKQKGSPNPEM